MSRGWRRRSLAASLVLSGALAAPRLSSADARTVWTPGVELGAGADSDVLFNNGGGDAVGLAGAKLRARWIDRGWGGRLELGARGYGFADRGTVGWGVTGRGDLHGQAGRDDRWGLELRLRSADDPLALAQMGLLGARGSAVAARATATWKHRWSRHWRGELVGGVDGVRRGATPLVESSLGGVVRTAGHLLYRLTRSWDVTVSSELRGYASDPAGTTLGTAVLVAGPGVRWRASPLVHTRCDAGVLTPLTDASADTRLVARCTADGRHRWRGSSVALGRDLAPLQGRAGTQVLDAAEAAWRWTPPVWDATARAGLYRARSESVGALSLWSLGADVALWRRVAEEQWVGASGQAIGRWAAAPDGQTTDLEDRFAFLVRWTWTAGRP